MNKIKNKIKNWKNYLLGSLLALILVVGYAGVVNAEVWGANLFRLNGTAIVPTISTWTLGSLTDRIAGVYATTGDFVSLTFSGISGNLDMGGYDITNGGTITTADVVATSTTKTLRLGCNPGVSQNITNASTTIVSSSCNVEINPDADYVLTSVPTIADGFDGEMIFVHNVSAFSVDVQDEGVFTGSNVEIDGASGTIQPGGTMTLHFSSSTGTWNVLSNPNTASAGANATTLNVRNTSGSPISAGKAVYITGWNAGQARPTIDLADADNSAKMPAIGITATAISNNGNGEVITFGNATNIIDTSSASVGDGMWASTTPGAIMFTRPVNDEIQRLGIVARSHATQGVVVVSGSGRTNDVPYVTANQFQALNFVASSATATSTFAGGLAIETSGLVYDYSTNNVGIGTATPDESLEIFNGNMKLGDSANTSRSFYFERNGSDVGVINTDITNLNIKAQNNRNILISDDNGMGVTVADGGNVGIATTSPLSSLSIEGTAGTDIFNVATSTGASLFKVVKEGFTQLGAFIAGTGVTATDGATITVDWLDGNNQDVTLGATGRTLAFSNVQARSALKLYTCQDGTGNRTITTYPSEVHWKDATAPTLSTGAGTCDILVFSTATSSATIYGSYSTGY